MVFIWRLAKFWLAISALLLMALFCIFNQDYIDVHWGQFGVTRVQAAVAYITCFFLGASVVTLFFGFDILKKTMEIRRLKKQVRNFEGRLLENAPSVRRDGSMPTMNETFHP